MSSSGSDISEDNKSNASAESLRIKPPTSIGTKIVQLLVVAMFIGAMVGAFCYVILDRESGTGADDEETELHRNASTNWTVLWTEYSDSGYCIFTKLPQESSETEEGGGEESGDKIESYWYQDNKKQRLFTRIDENYAAYVFQNYTDWAVIDPKTEKTISCYRDFTLGYGEFIHRLGLYNMIDRHSEIRRITNNKKVFVYDGEPSTTPLRNDTKVGYFVRAYADYETGVLLGWDTFYGKNSKIHHSQCWFDEMKPRTPPEAIWNTVPKECY